MANDECAISRENGGSGGLAGFSYYWSNEFCLDRKREPGVSLCYSLLGVGKPLECGVLGERQLVPIFSGAGRETEQIGEKQDNKRNGHRMAKNATGD